MAAARMLHETHNVHGAKGTKCPRRGNEVDVAARRPAPSCEMKGTCGQESKARLPKNAVEIDSQRQRSGAQNAVASLSSGQVDVNETLGGRRPDAWSWKDLKLPKIAGATNR